MNGKFQCSDETYSILAGFVVQGELGDHDPLDHVPGYLVEFPFLESKSGQVREEVEKLHRQNRLDVHALLLPDKDSLGCM